MGEASDAIDAVEHIDASRASGCFPHQNARLFGLLPIRNEAPAATGFEHKSVHAL
jgi:hypothetical protein